MHLASIPIRDADVLALSRLLRGAGFDDTAEKLENGYDLETKVLALTISDREAIIRALDDPPAGWPSSAAYSFASTKGSCTRASFNASCARPIIGACGCLVSRSFS